MSYVYYFGRYAILCKAAYTSLKGHSQPTARECKYICLGFTTRNNHIPFGWGVREFFEIYYAIFVSGANALAASIDAVSKYSGARAGDCTMLDALIPASNTLNEVYCNLEGIYSIFFLIKLKSTIFNIFSSWTEIGCRGRSCNCFCNICWSCHDWCWVN